MACGPLVDRPRLFNVGVRSRRCRLSLDRVKPAGTTSLTPSVGPGGGV